MSYILDALKRAEQERQLGQLPNAASSPVDDDYGQEKARWPWFLLALTLLALAAAAGSYWLARQQQFTVTAEPDTATPTSQLELPNKVVAVTTTPPRIGLSEPLPSKANAPKPITAEAKPKPAPEPVKRLTVAPATPEAPEPEIVKASQAKPSATPAQNKLAQAQAASAEQALELPWLREMDSAFRHSLPAIEIQFHRHSETPSRSFVMVDGLRYREGQILKSGPTVERIVKQGLVLRWQGERFVFPLNG